MADGLSAFDKPENFGRIKIGEDKVQKPTTKDMFKVIREPLESRYEKILIKPMLTKGLSEVRASCQSMYGKNSGIYAAKTER